MEFDSSTLGLVQQQPRRVPSLSVHAYSRQIAERQGAGGALKQHQASAPRYHGHVPSPYEYHLGQQSGIHPPPVPRSLPTERPHIPFATLIMKYLEEERLPAALKLLDLALHSSPSHQDYIKLAKLLAPPTITPIPETDSDRSQEYLWLKQNSHLHHGRWIAISGNTLVAEAQTLKELIRLVKSSGAQNPLIHKV